METRHWEVTEHLSQECLKEHLDLLFSMPTDPFRKGLSAI